MKLAEIIDLVDGELLTGTREDTKDIAAAFSSDLMSDVLTLLVDNMLLITGLCNIQAIRTAEMADITHLLFVRGKQPTERMIDLAKESGITLVASKYSMYRCSGILFSQGLAPVY